MNVMKTGSSIMRIGMTIVGLVLNDKNTSYNEEVISYGFTICSNGHFNDILYNNIWNDYKSE